MIPIAVSGMTLIPSVPGITATIVITDPPSTKGRAGGLGIYLDGTEIQVSAINYLGTLIDPGPHNLPLNATTTVTRLETKGVLRTGDQTETIPASAIIPNPEPPPLEIEIDVSFGIVILLPGQLKARSN